MTINLVRGTMIAATLSACRMGTPVLPSDSGTPAESTDTSVEPDAEDEKKTEDEIWADLCDAATLKDSPGGYKTTVIPLDLYCGYFDCAENVEAFVEQFSTCDNIDSDWPVCSWRRHTGCGTIQFEEPCDESCSHYIAFDEVTGSMLGFHRGSDTPLNVCGASDFLQVGQFSDYVWKQDVCDDAERTYCCNAG